MVACWQFDSSHVWHHQVVKMSSTEQKLSFSATLLTRRRDPCRPSHNIRNDTKEALTLCVQRHTHTLFTVSEVLKLSGAALYTVFMYTSCLLESFNWKSTTAFDNTSPYYAPSLYAQCATRSPESSLRSICWGSPWDATESSGTGRGNDTNAALKWQATDLNPFYWYAVFMGEKALLIRVNGYFF